ncbi:MAG: M20 family metallopeptidase [Candidatus Hodarchaeales archaeon]
MSECTYILKELVRLNSENPPGNTRALVEWIINWGEKNGITAKAQWHEENKGNVILSLGDSEESIILCGHLDTVPIGNQDNWDMDPLGGVEKDGYIYGRGAADMKGGVASCLGALKNLSKIHGNDPEFKIVFLGTFDEEVGLGGAKAAVDMGFMKSAKFLLVAEPTALNIGIAEKGVLWLTIHSYGKSAHGSTPEKGVNAIEKLVELFPTLHSEIPQISDPILGKSTLNIGVIRGGESANVVPETAEVHCDYRLVPPISPLEFSNQILDKIKTFSQNSLANFEMKIRQIMPFVSTPEENRFVKKFFEKCSSKEYIGLNYGTDAAILANQNPSIPFVIFGPGNPKKIHMANERVSVAELLEAEQIMTNFLKDYYFPPQM